VTFSEEFNGTTLDTSKLTPCFDWNFGDCTASFNAGKERHLPSQVRVNNGTAKLVAEPLSPPYNNGACPTKDYSAAFVRFGLDWQPTYVAWYIDGVKCGQFNGTSATIPNGPMQLILHMMIDNQWERDWGSVLSAPTLVRQLEVDYIRIYQQQ
jgi:Glycosyl hydrolases family 16